MYIDQTKGFIISNPIKNLRITHLGKPLPENTTVGHLYSEIVKGDLPFIPDYAIRGNFQEAFKPEITFDIDFKDGEYILFITCTPKISIANDPHNYFLNFLVDDRITYTYIETQHNGFLFQIKKYTR